MMDETDQKEFIYGAKEVADILNIKESTLRKYALLLKEHGYNFFTNDKSSRGYFEHDVTVLKRFVELKNNSHITLKQAARRVVTWAEDNTITGDVTEDTTQHKRHDEDISEIKETVNNQTEMIRELMNRLDDRDKYLNDRLEERDRLLMQHMNDAMEQKRLTAAAEEKRETSEEENPKKKGLIDRLLGS